MNKRSVRSLTLVLGIAVLLAAYIALVWTREPSGDPAPAGAPGAAGPSAAGPSAGGRSVEGGAPAPTATPLLGGVIVTRTPEPTATPGLVEREVEEALVRAGLARTAILGLTLVDWISLGRFALKVGLGYLAGTLLIRWVLPLITRRTQTEWDDRLLAKVGGHLRWLIVVIVLDVAMQPLTFLSADAKLVLGDLYFVLGLSIAVLAVWRTIDQVEQWYCGRAVREGREKELAPAITLLSRLARLLLAIVAGSALLAHFGVNVPALAAALGLGGLAISLAARDTIADAIAGLLILLDRPFRVGDRIEVQEVGTWGEVVEIGLRTTRICTWRNREVIVPNSHMGREQVVNYSYPDPRYLVVRQVHVAYGTDVGWARTVIVDAVRKVDGVLADRPARARYVEMGDSSMVFDIEWWIESIAVEREVVDRVNSCLQRALDVAGIETPYPTRNLNLHVEPETVNRLSSALGNRSPGPNGS
jgi:small-conductance mechanosensitive channel